jgi:hypothetical protein
MINKIFKRIHNQYSVLFKFIFFLRYLFGIFLISAVLFLYIPYFFDFEKKDSIIKDYLFENYGLKLNEYESIKYNALPTPNLEIFNASNSLNLTNVNLDTKNLKIYPKFISIYNLDNFKAYKIFLNSNNIYLELNELKILSSYIYKLKNKLTLNNSEFKILNEDKLLISLTKINFSNYGFNKNIIKGLVFNKKFKILIDDNFQNINFKLPAAGISMVINFDKIKKEGVLSGVIKAKVLNYNLKFDFKNENKITKINNAYFRSKELSFNHESVITHNPFFSMSSTYNIEDINLKLFKDLNINRILNSKKLIKKINFNNLITYEPKKFNRNLIEALNLKINLAYGRLDYIKIISISDSLFNCKGESNLLEEYPVLYFTCLVISENKKNLLKEFSIKYPNKNEPFNLVVNGNLNLLNSKINFNKIKMNKDYLASKEDLKYFKDKFESILFNQNFINIFNLSKIKKFILEIS